MRLIDADKLIKELNDAIKRKGLNAEDKKKGMWCAWFLDIIAQASTVEAIPFWWLRVYSNLFDYTTEDMVAKIHLANIVETIITDFQEGLDLETD